MTTKVQIQLQQPIYNKQIKIYDNGNNQCMTNQKPLQNNKYHNVTVRYIKYITIKSIKKI